jgi:glutamyl-tRNA reductase
MITAVGITHKIAPLAIREAFAFPPSVVERVLAGLPGEALLLVTCNRTELYGTALTDQLRQALLIHAGASSETPLFVRHGRDAVRHLFSVAAGLDSMVMGEPQILGQVKDAITLARQAGSLGTMFDRLARQALTVGRRVRRETQLGWNRPSIPKVATMVAKESLAGLSGVSLLVIGAGKVGGLTARSLREMGAGSVLVTNRTQKTAEALAREIGGRAAPFANLDMLVQESDIVISCTGSATPLLDVPRMQQVMAVRDGRPLVLIDLAVPRDIVPEVRALSGIRLFDLDDLRTSAADTISPELIRQAEAIVEQETQVLLSWLAGRQAVPTIRAIRRRAEAILEEELRRNSAANPDHLQEFGRRLLNKMLHYPLVRMRDRAASHGPLYVDVARDLFGLDSEDADE